MCKNELYFDCLHKSDCDSRKTVFITVTIVIPTFQSGLKWSPEDAVQQTQLALKKWRQTQQLSGDNSEQKTFYGSNQQF